MTTIEIVIHLILGVGLIISGAAKLIEIFISKKK